MKDNYKKFISEVTITLPFETKEIAKSVCLATAPENKEVPNNVKAISNYKENTIEFHCSSTERFWDLISTVEDFLEKVSISLNTIDSLK